MSTVFIDWRALPEEVREHFVEIEQFVAEMDGKTIATPAADGCFIDDGTVDAESAVVAVNAVAAFIMRAPAAVTEEQVAKAICCPTGCERPEDCWQKHKHHNEETVRAILALFIPRP